MPKALRDSARGARMEEGTAVYAPASSPVEDVSDVPVRTLGDEVGIGRMYAAAEVARGKAGGRQRRETIKVPREWRVWIRCSDCGKRNHIRRKFCTYCISARRREA